MDRKDRFQHAVSWPRHFAPAGAHEPREIGDLDCLLAALRNHDRLCGDGARPLPAAGRPLPANA
eukprot:2965172-Pyramimonas_sp.AAC.1